MTRWPDRLTQAEERAAGRDLRPRAADDDRRKRGGEGGPANAVITPSVAQNATFGCSDKSSSTKIRKKPCAAFCNRMSSSELKSSLSL